MFSSSVIWGGGGISIYLLQWVPSQGGPPPLRSACIRKVHPIHPSCPTSPVSRDIWCLCHDRAGGYACIMIYRNIAISKYRNIKYHYPNLVTLTLTIMTLSSSSHQPAQPLPCTTRNVDFDRHTAAVGDWSGNRNRETAPEQTSSATNAAQLVPPHVVRLKTEWAESHETQVEVERGTGQSFHSTFAGLILVAHLDKGGASRSRPDARPPVIESR